MPLYHRVYLLLRQSILEGEWGPDMAMPGEHDLANRHGVSRITIRRAMEQLESEQLVLRRRGAGTFAQRPKPEKRRENLRGLMENLLNMGLRTEAVVLEMDYVPAPAAIAAALGVAQGALVQKSVRLRSTAGVAFSHLTAWVPEEIGRRFQASDLAARPLLMLLEEAGVPAASADQVISAQLADSTVGPLLGVAVGSALICGRRIVRDGTGRVIEVIESLYRPDMYEYHLAMVRAGGSWDVAP
jgi:GntR family transcriptional regulator